MNEIWKPIKGYEGLYEVSNMGRVRSLDRVESVPTRWGGSMDRHLKGRILTPQLDGKKNYLHVQLGRGNIKQVHRLVAETFLPNTNNLPQINHKDENKLNNSVDNLEWCSIRYNNTYGSRVDLKKGERHHGAKLSEKQVHQIKERISFGEKQKDLAIEYGISRSQVSAIHCGRMWGWVV